MLYDFNIWHPSLNFQYNCHEADLNSVTVINNEHKKSISYFIKIEIFLIMAMRPGWTAALQHISTSREILIL